MMEKNSVNSKEVVVGLDMGTTSVKAVLFDTQGKHLLEKEQLITTYHPEKGWAEQDPEEIDQKTRLVLRDIMKYVTESRLCLLGVGFSTAMHSLICLDKNGGALSRMIIWSDGRSSKQAQALEKGRGKAIFLKTGTPIHPMTPFVKLVWMKENHFVPYHQADFFVTMKEYLVWKWFGVRFVDYGMASSTGLYNVITHTWDEEALKIAGITPDQLSEIVAPETVLPAINPDIAEQMGMPADVPFVMGSADGQLANLGDGAILPGEVAISVGTSGAIRQFAQGASVDPNGETFTYAFTEGTSIVGGPTNNGGIVVQWLKDVFEFEGSHEKFIAGAENIAPGAEGLLFIPYVNGERAPVWNQQAKGNFYGLNIVHRKDHFVRAVLEGIVFNLYHISKSLENLVGKPKSICVNGGLSQSSLWVQILADLFGQEIQLSETHHSAAWGAAWTVLVGIKKVNAFAEIKAHLNVRKKVQPDPENHKIYSELYKRYEKLAKDISSYFTTEV